MDSNSARRQPSAMLFWVTWPLLGLVALGSLFLAVGYGPLRGKTTLFHWTPAKCESFPVDARAHAIRVSDSGVVWVQTGKNLQRRENGTWRTVTAPDFGAHDFTLDGEDAWAIGRGGVLHFDGKRTTLYRDLKGAVSIAAVNGQAWTVDFKGSLGHFDGKAWSERKVDLPGVTSSAWGLLANPKLVALAKGGLWLIFEGVWREQGGAWVRVQGTSRDARLLGVTPASGDTTRGGVYVLDHGAVEAFDVDGAKGWSYDTSGLGKYAYVQSVSGRAPLFVVSYSAGLWMYDGSKWHLEARAKLGTDMVSDMAVSPDQSVWGIGRKRAEFASAWWTMLLPLAVVLYPMWYRSRKATYQREAAKEALLHANVELPEELKQKEEPAWKTGVAVAIILGVIWGGYAVTKLYWPGAPGWLIPVALLALHGGSTLVGALKPRKALPNDPIHPGGMPEIDWAKSQPALFGGLAVIVLLYGNSIARFLHIPYVAAMPGFAILLGGQFVFRAFDRFRAGLVEKAVRRGDYAGARAILDGPLAWPPSALWKLTRAELLWTSGKAEEAEPILRELLETNSKNDGRASALESLGRMLLAQSRFEEARRTFEAVIKMAPSRPAAHSGLAELRLMQGVETAQALESVQQARKLQSDRKRLAAIWADETWALAVLGRSSEAQQAMEAGARVLDRESRPEVAGFHWRCGMATRALEQWTPAAQWFAKAEETDPQGYYGRLAATERRGRGVRDTMAAHGD
jgi:Tfp pilus assembly protein PilF